MKNKGFTLIELLAVIVILAIVALIATPVILNIIDNSREESNKRSVDNYAKAVNTAVARYQLNEKKGISGSFTLSTNESKPKTLVNEKGEELVVEYDGAKVVCKTIIISEDGKLYMAECSVGETKIEGYEYGENPNVDVSKPKQIATIVNNTGTHLAQGTAYDVIVKSGSTYRFYIHSIDTTNNTVDLIMSANITPDGKPIYSSSLLNGSTKPFLTYKYDGPVEVMEYLHNATKDWNFVPNVNINIKRDTYTNVDGVYTNVNLYTIKTEGTNTMIYKEETAIDTLTDIQVPNGVTLTNLKAKLLSKSYSINENTYYLYDNLEWTNNISSFMKSGMNSITGVSSYWTFDYFADPINIGRGNYVVGVISNDGQNNGLHSYYESGIRPVITLPISELKN